MKTKTKAIDYPTTKLGMVLAAREVLLAEGGTEDELTRNAALIARYQSEKPTAEAYEPERGQGNGNGSGSRKVALATDAQVNFIVGLQMRKFGLDFLADTDDARAALAVVKGKTCREASQWIDRLLSLPDYVRPVEPKPVVVPDPIQAPTADEPKVLPGRYVVGGVVYRVTQGKLGGKWAGRTFARNEATDEPVKGAALQELLAAILADPKGCALEYAKLTACCSVCNRPLTNGVSIEEAMGPICSGRFARWYSSESEEEETVTTTANKAGLKAAAKTRSARHDQRTALPSRGEDSQTESYGKMTLAELRGRAKELGLSIPKGTKQGEILVAILAEEVRLGKPAKKVAKTEKTPTPRTPKPAPTTPEPPAGSKSYPKAMGVAAVADANGWASKVEFHDGDEVELTMTRGDEVLWISWVGGVMKNEPMPTYTIADRTIKLRNASAVKLYLGRAPETGVAELARVSSNRHFRKREDGTEAKAAKKAVRLPFDPATATEKKIIDALVGRSVSWSNRLRDENETAVVGPDPRRVSIREFQGHRVVWFCCPQTGFRAFNLDALLRVGGTVKAAPVRGKRVVSGVE